MPWKHITTEIGEMWEFEHDLDNGNLRGCIIKDKEGYYAGFHRYVKNGPLGPIYYSSNDHYLTFDEAQQAAEKWIAEIILETQ